MAAADLTASRIRELLAYDPETGSFTWITGRRGVGRGSKAGYLCLNGYIYISIDNNKCLAHRVAWIHTYGEWPKHDIDHINCIRTDNRLVNLRDVERYVNNQNRAGVKSTNKVSGMTGVSWHIHSRKWRARISLQGKEYRVGLYDTPQEASEAYLTAKRKLHAGCRI
jgi:hypothetical protein